MISKQVFRLVSTLFWLLVLGLVIADTVSNRGVRLEPPPIALGSGQAASGGHCSGR